MIELGERQGASEATQQGSSAPIDTDTAREELRARILKAQATATLQQIERRQRGEPTDTDVHNDEAEARHAALRAQRPSLKGVGRFFHDLFSGKLFPDDLQAKSKHMWQGPPLQDNRPPVKPVQERPTRG